MRTNKTVDKISAEMDRVTGEYERKLTLHCAQMSMVASQLMGDPKIDPTDRTDPRWTPALYEAWVAVQRHKADADRINVLTDYIDIMLRG